MKPRIINKIKNVSFKLYDDNTFECKFNGRTPFHIAAMPQDQIIKLARVLSRMALHLWTAADCELGKRLYLDEAEKEEGKK